MSDKEEKVEKSEDKTTNEENSVISSDPPISVDEEDEIPIQQKTPIASPSPSPLASPYGTPLPPFPSQTLEEPREGLVKKKNLMYSRRETETLEGIFNFLVTSQPNVIKTIYNRVKPVEHTALSVSLVNLSFSNNTTFPLLHHVIKDEFETCNLAQVLRENSIASKLVKAYTEKVGREYLVDMFGKFINTIMVNDRKNSFELDLSKVSQVEADKNRALLEKRTEEILDYLLLDENINKMPSGIRIISKFIAEQSQIHAPDQITIMVGSFLFLRYFNPALFSPENIDGLVSKGKVPNSNMRRNLILVTKVLQNLSNSKSFGQKEAYMKPMDGLIAKHKVRVSEYFQKIIDFQCNLNVIHENMKNEATVDDLHTFHALLFSLKDDITNTLSDQNLINEYEKLLQKLGSYQNKVSFSFLEESDQKNVKLLLDTKAEEASFVSYVEISHKKKKAIKLVMIIGRHKIFWVKPGGKMFQEAHQLDLTKLVSEKPNEVLIAFKNDIEIVFTTKEDQVDSIIDAIRRSYSFKFHGKPAYELRVKPESRLNNFSIEDDSPCDGLVETYTSLCNYYGVPVYDSICWAINNLYVRNRVLDLSRFVLLSEMPLSDRDSQPLFHALGFNSHFHTLNIKGMKFDKTSIQGLVNMFAINRSLTSVTISDVSLKDRTSGAFADIFEALTRNEENALTSLDLSCSILDDKRDKKELATFFSSTKNKFMKINLSQKIEKSGESSSKTHHFLNSESKTDYESLKRIMTAISTNKKSFDSITELSLNANKIDNQETTKEILKCIKSLESLEVLEMAATKVSPSSLARNTLTVSALSQNLTTLNISNHKMNKDENWIDFIKWLGSDKTCGLQSIDISSTTIPIECFIQLVGTVNPNLLLNIKASKNNFGLKGGQMLGTAASTIQHIHSLDLSNNNFGDDGVIALAKGIFHNSYIRTLNIDNNFRYTTSKTRKDVIYYLLEMLGSRTLSLESLSMAGNARTNKDSRLKESLVDFLSKFGNNPTLTELDITGHNAGNGGAIALGKMLEINQTLSKLSWDENGTGWLGLLNFKVGLKLNGSLRDMPLPVCDIAKMLEIEDKEQKELVLKNVKVIEGYLRRNQQY